MWLLAVPIAASSKARNNTRLEAAFFPVHRLTSHDLQGGVAVQAPPDLNLEARITVGQAALGQYTVFRGRGRRQRCRSWASAASTRTLSDGGGAF